MVLEVKNLAAIAGDIRGVGLIPGSGESLGVGQVFLPGEYHVQRSLAGYSL